MVKLSAELHTTFEIVPAIETGAGRGVGMLAAFHSEEKSAGPVEGRGFSRAARALTREDFRPRFASPCQPWLRPCARLLIFAELKPGASTAIWHTVFSPQQAVRLLAIAAVLAALVAPAAAQQPTPLTLAEAVQMTLDKNPMHKAALADTRPLRLSVREARSPLLPRMMFAENFTRGNDPVFVFGSRLRQQIFTAQDFALNSLNRPTPIGNYRQPLLRPVEPVRQHAELDRRESREIHEARRPSSNSDRTDQELVFQTVQAYYGVLLAQKQLQVAEDAVKTAEAIEQQSRARVESGMAVDSDLLSAQVLTSSRKQELIAAAERSGAGAHQAGARHGHAG